MKLINHPNLNGLEKLIEIIDNSKSSNLIISIDGNSGAGKTYYSEILSTLYDSNIIHMDSFFLPVFLRTEKRLGEVAGNIHYERFEQEVLKNLKKEIFKYRVYDCKLRDYRGEVCLNKKKLTMVEGVYSQSHNFKEYYDVSASLICDKNTQIERIRQREGGETLKVFLEKWIPLEDKYFTANDIFEKSDILIET